MLPDIVCVGPLVEGATGATGQRIVKQLRAKGVNVRAASRDVKKAEGLGLGATGAGAELVQLDVLDTASIDAAMAGVSAVVCATGFTPSFNIKRNNPAGPPPGAYTHPSLSPN